MVFEFHWILPGRLAGSGLPGLFSDFDEDLDALFEVGIRRIVSLTENPLPEGVRPGLRIEHFPIPDMGCPSLAATRRLVADVVQGIEAGEATLFHCRAGLGRTGTLLACCLLHVGRSAEEALAEIRRIVPRYVQTEGQEQFVRYFQRVHEGSEAPFVLPRMSLPGSSESG